MTVSPRKIVIVGCGIVGAMLAYELSIQFSAAEADIQVLDQQSPGQGSTGAALGVLMGIISHKVKGRTWRLRETSVRRYATLIEELSQQGQPVPFNNQGIVSLCFDEKELPRWETLKQTREDQGWPLEIWTSEELQRRCPHIDVEASGTTYADSSVKAAIYSPEDGQVSPPALTQALIKAAQVNGVTFCNEADVTQLEMQAQRCVGVQTQQGYFAADWVVLCAGLGSAAIARSASAHLEHEPLTLMPVLGQAMEIQLPNDLGNSAFQPVINGNDIHLVPLTKGRYWIGATVEFPSAAVIENEEMLKAEADGLINLRLGAERFCGALADAEVIRTWSGLRPRPVGQAAPVIQPLGDCKNVTLATGHYRNGVLLAPATAQQVCELLQAKLLFNYRTQV